jgi:uncharacterized membrane protein (DUF373 family)
VTEQRPPDLPPPPDRWSVLGAYERFEQFIALVMSGVIAIIILVLLLQLVQMVHSRLLADIFRPIDHGVFQTVFAVIMTLLIAMEFKHTILRAALRRDSIIQVRTVVLIALIALARKFILIDADTDPAKIAALAGATIALGVTYWLLDERDDARKQRESPAPP